MRRHADFDWLDHTGDLRIVVRGADESRLYESAVLATAELIAERPDGEPEVAVSFDLAGATPEVRLIELLREVLFRFDVDLELPVACRVELDGERLVYSGRAVIFDASRHEGLREIKAVTWHQLEIGARAGGWEARIVYDL